MTTTTKRKAKPKLAAGPGGVIERGASYTRDEFRRRTGLSPQAIRSAKKRGLRLRRVGKRLFILGDDWHEFLEQQSDSDDSASQAG